MSAVSWLSCSQYIKRCFVHSSLESSALCQAASISQSSAGPTSQRGAAPLPEIQKFPKFWGGPDADRDGCMRDSCSPKRRRGKGTACPSAPAALCHSPHWIWDLGCCTPSFLSDPPAGAIHSGTAPQILECVTGNKSRGGQDHCSQQLTAGRARL